MSRRPLSAAGLAAALLLAGCGGSKSGSAPASGVFTADGTRSCLEKAGARVDTSPGKLGLIANAAAGGGLFVQVGGDSATVAFGNDAKDAARIERAFRRFAKDKQRVGNLLQRKRNVVVTWLVEPHRAERRELDDCLR